MATQLKVMLGCSVLVAVAGCGGDVVGDLEAQGKLGSEWVAGSFPAGMVVGMNNKCLFSNGAAGAPMTTLYCEDRDGEKFSYAAGALKRKGATTVVDAIGERTSNGTLLTIWADRGAENQRWKLTKANILGGNEDKLAFDPDDNEVTTFPTRPAFVAPGSLDNLKTTWNVSGNGKIELAGTGKCLGTVGDTVGALQWACESQRWTFGGGQLRNTNQGKCLEVKGAQAYLAACNGSAAQRFHIKGEIRGEGSNKCIDDPSRGQRAGEKVHLWDCHGGANQQWDFYPGGTAITTTPDPGTEPNPRPEPTPTPTPTPAPNPSGTVTRSNSCTSYGWTGTCFGTIAMWMQSGQCKVRNCADEGKTCGLISNELGYGCMPAAVGGTTANCSTYGFYGHCYANTLVWVENNACWAKDCASGGLTCKLKDATWGYDCL